MRLAAETVGTGPALVLLHGLNGSAAAWGDVLAALARGRRVVAVDLPGHGGSPAPEPAAAWRLPRVAAACVEVLDRLAIGRADWLGYSLGGRVALHVALAHPERVDRLVLESTSPGIADAAERGRRAAADAALADGIERDGMEAFVDRWLAQPLFRTQARLPAAVQAAERRRRLAAAPAALAAALRAMGPGTQEPLWARLGELAAPALCVAGTDDAPYCAHAAAMAQAMPRARTAVVADAGHTVHLERPAAFVAAVTGFLAGAARAA